MGKNDVTLISPQYGETVWPTMGLLRGFADWSTRWEYMAIPDPGPIHILDVGGGAGAFTLICKQTWPRVQITVLEPSPIILPYLYQNIGELDDVHILEVAASNDDKPKLLSMAPYNLLGQDTLHGSGEDGNMVECRKLDDIIDKSINIMKIDVEGHEVQVLEGAMGILERDHPDIIVEVKKIVKGTSWDARPALEEMGYAINLKLGQDFFYGWPR